MKRIFSILLSILMIFQLMPLSITAEEPAPAPGTAQDIQIVTDKLVDGRIPAYKVIETHRAGTEYEKIEEFFVYCFQEDYAWPEADKKDFYPEELKKLKENPEAMEAVRRVLFAGFPNNGANLYEPGQKFHTTADILNSLLVMSDEIKEIFVGEGIEVSGLNFSFGNDGTGPLGYIDSNETLALLQMAIRAVSLPEEKPEEYEILRKWQGYSVMFSVFAAYGYDEYGIEPYSTDNVLERYDEVWAEGTTDGIAHKATQDAVWAVLKHFEIEGNDHKEPDVSTLSKILYEFAFSDSPIPSATVTEEQIIQNIKLIDYITPESEEFKIVFKRNPENGHYYSQTLKIMGQDEEGGNSKNPIYDLLYNVSFDDSTEITKVRNNEDFRLELSTKPDTNNTVKIKLGTELRWPSRVFEYKTDGTKTIQYKDGEEEHVPYQTMGGLYLKEKTLSGEYDYVLAPTGSLQITKRVEEESKPYLTGDAFEFTIKLKGDGLNGSYPAKINGTDFAITCTNNEIKANLKADETLTISELPEGTPFEIKETKIDHWSYKLSGSKSGKIVKDEITSVTFTNKYSENDTPETTELSVAKTWNDGDNQDGIRPASVTVKLLADGVVVKDSSNEEITATLGARNSWKHTFEDLPKYEEGEEIAYSVEEVSVTGYEPKYTTQEDGTILVTNTHTPETTEVTVKKVWDDSNNQDGKRPDSVVLQLLANDEEVEGKTIEMKKGVSSVTTNDAGTEYSYTFTNLPKYQEGKEIEYSVKEVSPLLDGYTSKVEGFTVTNTHTPETVAVTGTKTWDDSGITGHRPETVTIRLHADGDVIDSATISSADGETYEFNNLPKYKDGEEIEYTISEDAVVGYEPEYIDGSNKHEINIKNTHRCDLVSLTVSKKWEDHGNQDGLRPSSVKVNLLKNGKPTGDYVILDETNRWENKFVDLEYYTDNTHEDHYTYTVEEEIVKGYNASYSGNQEEGYVITNTHTPETVDVTGTKTWDDSEITGHRPETVTIRLHADGDVIDSTTIPSTDGGTYEFKNLPKYKNGKAIKYTISEDAVVGYMPTFTSASDYVINTKNTHHCDLVSLTVSKTWDDHGNQDGLRPSSVKVNLLKNGEPTGKFVVLEDKNNWEDEFVDLEYYTDSTHKDHYIYTVQEEAVNKYSTTYHGNQEEGYVITNTHTPEEINLVVKKVWKDADNNDGFRPDYVKFQLYAGTNPVGTPIRIGKGETGVTEVDSNTYTYEFKNLPKYKDGEEIVYTVKEVDVPENYSEKYSDKNLTVTNTHVPENVSVSVEKIWNDGNNADRIRPTSVTVTLLADGVVAKDSSGEDIVVKLDSSNLWKHSFDNLPKYKDGSVIIYTVKEDSVSGYATYIEGNMDDGFEITNRHVPTPPTPYTPPKTGIN